MGGRPRLGWVRRGELTGMVSAGCWLEYAGRCGAEAGGGGEGGVSMLDVVEVMVAETWF